MDDDDLSRAELQQIADHILDSETVNQFFARTVAAQDEVPAHQYEHLFLGAGVLDRPLPMTFQGFTDWELSVRREAERHVDWVLSHEVMSENELLAWLQERDSE